MLGLSKTPRIIEGVDIAHLGGQEMVASLVCFIDGLPFKPGYRRYRIRTVEGVDDFASIREVVSRRFRGPRSSPKEKDGETHRPGHSAHRRRQGPVERPLSRCSR